LRKPFFKLLKQPIFPAQKNTIEHQECDDFCTKETNIKRHRTASRMSWKTFHDFITGELLRMMFQKAFDVFFCLRNCRLRDDVSAGNGEILEKWWLRTFKSGGIA